MRRDRLALLDVQDIRVRYGAIEAVKGISLSVEEGEIVTLIGGNGAGKTTTLKAISGVLHPVAGAIRFQGKRIDDRPAHEIVTLGIGHAPEGRKIFGRMSVTENLEMGLYAETAGRGDRAARRRHAKESRERVYTLFPRLKERERQAGGTLSGGEQQMLAIGRALMTRPALLMLDEPSMGLAPILVERIFEVLRDIHEQGTTILLVEQNAHMALNLADRGYVIESGNIVLEDSARSLLGNDEVRKAYLGEA
jgi:branched-chain amino acid transport system ATP-binding protein